MAIYTLGGLVCLFDHTSQIQNLRIKVSLIAEWEDINSLMNINFYKLLLVIIENVMLICIFKSIRRKIYQVKSRENYWHYLWLWFFSFFFSSLIFVVFLNYLRGFWLFKYICYRRNGDFSRICSVWPEYQGRNGTRDENKHLDRTYENQIYSYFLKQHLISLQFF